MIVVYLTYFSFGWRGHVGIADEDEVAMYKYPLWQITDCVWMVPEAPTGESARQALGCVSGLFGPSP